MGWLAPPGVDGAGEGGEVRKKNFTVTFISNLILNANFSMELNEVHYNELLILKEEEEDR